ncbi:PAS domain S-box protein [Bacillus sp. FJAT-52991]|uniref:histidine kinase n=1 Tax=Bacillus kandeliae TaxID=3129297 RepID=A0ABZ2NAC5_9BACI
MGNVIFNSSLVSTEEFEWFIQMTKDMFLAIDHDGVIQFVNPALVEVLGYDKDEFIGRHFSEYIHFSDQESTREQFEEVIRGGKLITVENRCLCKEGGYAWMSWNAASMAGQKMVLIIGQDISRQKRLESELIQSNQYLQSFWENTDDAVDLIDLEGNVIAVNKAFEKIFGWTNEEVQGRTLPIIPDALYSEFQQIRTKVLSEQKMVNYETMRLRKDGSMIPVSITASPIRNEEKIVALSVISRDHSMLVEAKRELINRKKELRKTNDRLENILKSIIEAFFFVDDHWNIVYVNDVFANMWGKNQEGLVGQNFWDAFPEIKGTIYEHYYKQSMNTQESQRFQVYSKVYERYFEICTFPSLTGLAVNTRDITDYQMNLQKLKESEKQIREITENINEVFCVHNVEGFELLYVSKAFEKIWKRSLSDLYQNHFQYIETIHPEDREYVIHQITHFKEAPDEFEFRMIRPSGEVRWIRSRQTVISNQANQPKRIISVLEDITELKEKDILIRKGDKLGAVGQLAAGIAHEIRNPLTTIKGFVQLWGKESPTKYSDIILSELQRIEFIMNEFLMLAKPHQELKMEKLHLNKILNEVMIFMQPEALLHNANIVNTLAANLPTIFGEMKQIKQVIINLIKNALEAMPNGGIITMLTKYDNNRVIIELIDEGIGIQKDRIARLGEPFYSNKEKGTGLGLMVSFKIIQNHKGTISFESEEGKGTKVIISLPVYKENK